MKKFFGLLVLLLFVVNLTAIKNWKLYTNTTYIYDILRVGDNLFIASWGGLEIYNLDRNDFEKKYTTIDGLSDNDIKCLDYQENEEMFLLGTADSGVNRMNPSGFQMSITETIGLVSNNVRRIVHNDSLIFISTTNGLSVFSNNENFPFPVLQENYTVENGLSDNKITSLKLTENYLLCGSESGLDFVSIDSLSEVSAWHHLNPDNSPLPSENVSSIAVKDEKIAVATDNGILFSENFIDFSSATILKEGNSVFPVFLDSDENLWFGYGKWNEDNLTIDDSSEVAVVRIAENGDERIWTVSESIFTTNEIFGFKEYEGEIFAYTWGEGIFIFDGDDWNKNIKKNCILANLVTDVEIDKNNNIWTCNGYYGGVPIGKGTKGVSEFDGANWNNFTAENSGLSSNIIVTIAVDGNNKKWFGSWNINNSIPDWYPGISVYDDSNDSWEHYTTADGLLTSTISKISLDSRNRIWVCSYDGGVNILDENGSIESQFTIPEDPDDFQQKIVFTFQAKNATYIGSYFHGLNIWNHSSDPETNGEYWEVTPFSDLQSGQIFDIVSRDYFGTEEIWIASSNGLYMFDGVWNKFGIDIKRKDYINGSWHYEHDPYYLYFVDQERLYGAVATYPTALFVDPFGIIWIGTHDNGVTAYDTYNNIFTTYNTENSDLVSNSVTDFAYESKTGTLYIGTVEGLNSVEIGISEEANEETTLNKIRIYPNPFYPERGDVLKIENLAAITMPKGNTKCKIYNADGDLIITLKKDNFQQFHWNGLNAAGKKCSSGIYFYVIGTENGQIARGKFALIR